MKSLWVMSIVGCVLFVLSFLFISVFMENDKEAAMGWGVIACFYGLALSIVGIVQTAKLRNK